jgi:hypothetical protein
MLRQQVRLKQLMQRNHWQTYRTFCKEYDRAAKAVDGHLIGSWPSRAQLHRWMSGELKSLPYSDHCRVLEAMFPGWNAEQLFELLDVAESDSPGTVSASADIGTRIAETLSRGIAAPDAGAGWGRGTQLVTSGATAGMLRDQGHDVRDQESLSRAMADKLMVLGKVQRMPGAELEQLGLLAGNLVDLELSVRIDIGADGAAVVAYSHHLLNLTSEPISRFAREIWFEYTTGSLSIHPSDANDRRVGIHRINSTGTMAKFNCRMAPPLQPGESTSIGYSCTGGLFKEALYWRQVMHRFTRKFTLVVRHEGVEQLTSCTVLTEHPNGSETSTDECVIWDYDERGAVMTATLDCLVPHQAVTLSWETP